ncbi:MAG: 4-hydroxy-tetrahydrodipicolinate reductase [Planctomycetia bacterium]|nr:4-hydroxy-tetrahydrodipicolinate reductase [Planctomycetia bacterium]
MKIAISGAAGRMGIRLITLASADPDLEVVAAFEMKDHPKQGEDAGIVAGIGPIHVPITTFEAFTGKADAVIDFSSPMAFDSLLAWALASKTAIVYATTGTSQDQMARLREAAKVIPVLWSPSMSMCVNLTMKLAKIAAKTLADKDADVEILERHHRYKADAPSGTALKFGQLIAEEMGIENSRHGREGKIGARPHNEIAYHAIRVGDNPGEHTIVFGLLGETLELTVKASNRDSYASGALAAAKYLSGKPVGFYGMDDVLDL